MRDDPFYVGYHPVAPAPIGRFTRRAAVSLVGLVVVAAALLATQRRPSDPSVFEYGIERRLTGRIVEHPYPTLLVSRPGITDRAVAYSRYYLVAEGKHGAEQLVRGLDGQDAALDGSLIYRDGATMLEAHTIEPGAAGAPRRAVPQSHTISLGRQRLVGEIVDSKCYLGVMRPGNGAVHRGCASRCLSGGAPPLLILSDSTGPAAFLLLTGPDGAPLPKDRLLSYVATPVEVRGEVVREGELTLMRAESVVPIP
jgi:hypothetical protein